MMRLGGQQRQRGSTPMERVAEETMAYCALHKVTFSDVEDCPACAQDEDDEICTCDIDGEENCPAHYPIDDGTDDEELDAPCKT